MMCCLDVQFHYALALAKLNEVRFVLEVAFVRSHKATFFVDEINAFHDEFLAIVECGCDQRHMFFWAVMLQTKCSSSEFFVQIVLSSPFIVVIRWIPD